MKWIKGVQGKIVGPDGKTIEPKTIKDIITECVFMAQSEPSIAIRKSTKIIPMLNAGKDSIEFEDKDFEIIKKSVEDNPVKLFDGALGQVLSCFEVEKK